MLTRTTDNAPGRSRRQQRQRKVHFSDVKLVAVCLFLSRCYLCVFSPVTDDKKFTFCCMSGHAALPGNSEPRAIRLQKWGPGFLLSGRQVTENELTPTISVGCFLTFKKITDLVQFCFNAVVNKRKRSR